LSATHRHAGPNRFDDAEGQTRFALSVKPDPRLRNDARGRNGGIRQELAAPDPPKDLEEWRAGTYHDAHGILVRVMSN
jgi:hypothetical protein